MGRHSVPGQGDNEVTFPDGSTATIWMTIYANEDGAVMVRNYQGDESEWFDTVMLPPREWLKKLHSEMKKLMLAEGYDMAAVK